MTDKEAITIANLIATKIIPRHTCPNLIISDRGSEFNNNLMKQLVNHFGINKVMTSPYHPMSNGTVERFHRDLNAMLRKFSNGNNTLWEEYLPHALLAARNTVNIRTGHTPFYLLYGRDAIMPLDTILAPRRKGYSDDFLSDMLKRQSRAFEVVKENTTEMRRKNREYHDKKVKLQNYVVGDLCYYNDRAK